MFLHALTLKIPLLTPHFLYDSFLCIMTWCTQSMSFALSLLRPHHIWCSHPTEGFPECSRLFTVGDLRGTKKIKQYPSLIISKVVLVDGGGKWATLGKILTQRVKYK